MLNFMMEWAQKNMDGLMFTAVAVVALYMVSRVLSPRHQERVMSRRETVDDMFTKEVLYKVEDHITDGVERLIAEKKITAEESRALLYRTGKRYNMPNLMPRRIHNPEPTPAAADLKRKLLHGSSSISDRLKGSIHGFLFKPKEDTKTKMKSALVPKK